MNERFVAFDIETTGLYPARGDRIIEVGAIAIENNKPAQLFHSFIRTDREISSSARKVHGIKREMLLNQPSPDEVLKRFHSFLSNSAIIAHNAKFDLKFLRHEYSRLGLSLSNKSFCTLELSRKFFPRLPDHKLETVYRHVAGCPTEKIMVHRALCDAGLVARIWMNFGVAAVNGKS